MFNLVQEGVDLREGGMGGVEGVGFSRGMLLMQVLSRLLLLLVVLMHQDTLLLEGLHYQVHAFISVLHY